MGVRIQELPETTGIKKEDVLIVEDGQGTKKGTVKQLDEALGVSQLKEDLGDFLTKEIGDNKFDESKILSGKRLNTDGSFTETENYFTTDFINISKTDIFSIQIDNVQGGTQRVFSSVRCAVYYDGNKSVIGSIENNSPEPLTKLNNAKFVRLSLTNTTLVKRLSITFSSEIVGYSEYAVNLSLNTDVEVNGSSLLPKSVEKEKLDIFKKKYGTNRLDLSKATNNKNFDSNGNEITSTNYAITDYIDVSEADVITFQGFNVKRIIVSMRYVIAYDSSKTIISINQNLKTFEIPINCKYVRISFPIRYYQESTEPSVVFTDTIIDYEPYAEYDVINGKLSIDDVIGFDEFEKLTSENISNAWKSFRKVDSICDSYDTTSEYVADTSHSNVDVIYNLYDFLVTNYPDYVTRTLLGYADEKPIYRYDFTPKLPQNSNMKDLCKILYCSGTHGGERPNILVGYRFFKDLCDNWRTQELLSDLRFNVHFTVVPIVNPYGFVTGTRKNENGVDLNRNFTRGWKAVEDTTSQYYSGSEPASEISTQLIENMCDTEHFDFGLDHHIFDYFASAGKVGYFVNTIEKSYDVSFSDMVGVWINGKLLKSNSNITDLSKNYFQTLNQGDCGGYLFGAFENGMVFETIIGWGDDSLGTDETAQKYNVEVLGAIFETAKNEYHKY